LRTPIPLVDIVEPNIDNDNDNEDDDDNNKGAVSRGGGRTTSKWDLKEVARRRRATEDVAMAREDGGGVATCKDVVLWLESYCIHRNKI
jgi:hypothetical protein